mgnify:FL=1
MIWVGLAVLMILLMVFSAFKTAADYDRSVEEWFTRIDKEEDK